MMALFASLAKWPFSNRLSPGYHSRLTVFADCTEMARSERFELPTLGIEIRCSIQLSYERTWANSDIRDVGGVLPNDQKHG